MTVFSKALSLLLLAKLSSGATNCAVDQICDEYSGNQEACDLVEENEQVTGCQWINSACKCSTVTTSVQETTTTPTTEEPTTTKDICTPEPTNITIPDECTTDILTQITTSTPDSCTSKFTDCGCDKEKLPNILTFDGINYDTDSNTCCYEYTSKRTKNKNCGNKNNAQSHIVIEMDCNDITLYDITNVNDDSLSKAKTDPTSCLNGIKIDHGCDKDECKYQVCVKYDSTIDQCCTKLGFYNIKAGKYNIKHQTLVPSCDTSNCEFKNCTHVNCADYGYENCPDSCVQELDSPTGCITRANAGLLDATSIDGSVTNDESNTKNSKNVAIYIGVGIALLLLVIGISWFMIRKKKLANANNANTKNDVEYMEMEN